MIDPRPQAHRPSDPMLAIRGDEVLILREELAKAQAITATYMERTQKAERDAHYWRGRFRDLLRDWERVVGERDAARALAQAASDQAPVWESGPTGIEACPACRGITEHVVGCPEMDQPR